MDGEFVPFGHPSPMLDHLGDLRRHTTDGGRFGFLVDEPKLNGRRLLHAGALSTVADVVIGHSLGATMEPPGRYVTTSLEVHFVGAGEEGDWVDVTVSPVRIGRRLAVGTATFSVGGRPVGFATAAFMPAS
jgi:acyl-coenzyme A thioesterase PaaI-like protein